ncbi:MAG: hypothetical protein IJK29_02280 [Bacteroidales bacterium]|nr:hypothetical protein [Bacteroidales bacterium]
MEPHTRALAKTASVHVKPYLAEYAMAKYPTDPANGGLLIPESDDLYHCLWSVITRPRRDSRRHPSPNLTFSLPCPSPNTLGSAWKNPARYNHIPLLSMIEIERCLQRQFDFELHRAMFENMESDHPVRQLDVALAFIRQYRLRSIGEESLLKNFSRYRNNLRLKKARRYTKGKRRLKPPSRQE